MAGTLSFIQELYREGADFPQFVKEFIEFLREEMLACVAQKKMEDVSFFFRCIEHFQQALSQMKSSLIPQLPVEIAVIRFLSPESASPQSPEIQKPKSSSVPKQSEKIPSKVTAVSALKSIPQEKASSVDLDHLSEFWPRVVEHLKTPSLKQSLREVKNMRATDKHVIELEFLSKFYMEKVLESSHRVELEGAIEKVFGHCVKVVGAIQKIELAPKIESPSASTVADVEMDSMAQSAAEIFGGEIIEEGASEK